MVNVFHDDHRKFTELYNVQHLTSNTIDPVSKVCITTIQRLYSMFKGEPEFEDEIEEESLFEVEPEEEKPKEISYNPQNNTKGGRCYFQT